MNRAIFMGRLCRDPETRSFNSSDSLVTATLAQDTKRKDASGAWVNGDPIFLDIAIWGSRGEAFARFHKKGDMALVEGRLKLDSWDDKKTGEKRSKIRLDVTDWHFVKSGSGTDVSTSPLGDKVF